MAACFGSLAAAPIYPPGAKAAAITYAEDDIPSVPALEWPSWTADRPQPGIAVKAGEPLCTVYACDRAAAAAKALADERRRRILAWMHAG
jgi:predicted ATP-grasp superfamily ATP-dependent carboligase